MSDQKAPKPILPNEPPPPPPDGAPSEPAPDEKRPEPTRKSSRPEDGWDQHGALKISDSAARVSSPLRQGPASPVGLHGGGGPRGFGTVLI